MQHTLSDGSHEAADEHVRQDPRHRDHRDDRGLRADPLLRLLVEEERVGADVRGDPVLRHDLVQHLLHPLRQGRGVQMRGQDHSVRYYRYLQL